MIRFLDEEVQEQYATTDGRILLLLADLAEKLEALGTCPEIIFAEPTQVIMKIALDGPSLSSDKRRHDSDQSQFPVQ